MKEQRVPEFRDSIDVTVHVDQHGEESILLHDPLGIAEGPILVSVDTIRVLEACNGIMTWDDMRTLLDIGDEKDWLQVRALVGQLDDMGYMDTDRFHERVREHDRLWSSLDVRPAVCAGTSYPDEAEACRRYLDRVLAPGPEPGAALGALIPHIDFAVAAHVYGPAFDAIRETDADLFVMIGTSHYWSDEQIILTEKHFATPLGIVRTDRDLVAQVRAALASTPAVGRPVLSDSDMAHKPEFSLEFHALGLQYLFGHRPFTILPILVTGLDYERSDEGAWGRAIAQVVAASGRKVCWLISGDLAHVGLRFGDDRPASGMIKAVQTFDRTLLGHLENGDVGAYHAAIVERGNATRICGEAPTWVALSAMGAVRGRRTVYDVWDDTETRSAVTFAGMAFDRP